MTNGNWQVPFWGFVKLPTPYFGVGRVLSAGDQVFFCVKLLGVEIGFF